MKSIQRQIRLELINIFVRLTGFFHKYLLIKILFIKKISRKIILEQKRNSGN